MSDLISRQDAINGADEIIKRDTSGNNDVVKAMTAWKEFIKGLLSAQPERLTDDDFETIRIHLNAYKEKLCNQRRWEEAEEYQRIIDRFMAFASAQPERKKGKWIYKHCVWFCSECGENPTKGMGYVQGHQELYDFCPKCGADMRGGEQE